MKARSQRNTGRLLVLTSVLLIFAALTTQVAGATDDPAVVGQWTSQIPVGLIGVGAALLHTGKVLLWESREGGTGSKVGLFDPNTLTTQDLSIQYPRNVFCSGSFTLPDGRLLITGGDPPSFVGAKDVNVGTKDVSIFDPVTETWSELPKMAFPRWYPSDVELANGTVLVFSGNDDLGQRVLTVESFDPSTNTWTTLPATANKELGLYPRTLLLPSGQILTAGKLQNTNMFDPSTNTWTSVGPFNVGERKEGGAVLLPGLTKALAAGGRSTAGVVTNTAEILDLTSPTPQWTYTSPMARPRINENLVLLADGTVLAVGGGSGTPFGNPEKSAELYDPATGTWTTMASQTANRTYHSTALLLPDGRVLSAGSTNGLPEETTVEIYSPPYLFKGPRPTITNVQTQIGYGQSFDITTPDSADISRVALIRPGTVTHAVNFDQRYVDMNFTTSNGIVTATAPTSGNVAPPGYYMLVVVNSAGVPSVASWVQLPVPSSPPPPPPTISGFTPTSGAAGTHVTITGTHFTGASDVRFNGTSVGTANFTVDTDTQITATVPAGATTGLITVVTPGGSVDSSTTFSVTGGALPTISSFTPTSGAVGTLVTVNGTNFTASAVVKFNGVTGTGFVFKSATKVKANVPAGATTGPISVTTASGTATSAANFTVPPPPTITGFSPPSGPVGTSVTINGTNFTGVTVVKFNGVIATFTFNSDTMITATVPAGATTGKIIVKTPGGSATSPTKFTVT